MGDFGVSILFLRYFMQNVSALLCALCNKDKVRGFDAASQFFVLSTSDNGV